MPTIKGSLVAICPRCTFVGPMPTPTWGEGCATCPCVIYATVRGMILAIARTMPSCRTLAPATQADHTRTTYHTWHTWLDPGEQARPANADPTHTDVTKTTHCPRYLKVTYLFMRWHESCMLPRPAQAVNLVYTCCQPSIHCLLSLHAQAVV